MKLPFFIPISALVLTIAFPGAAGGSVHSEREAQRQITEYFESVHENRPEWQRRVEQPLRRAWELREAAPRQWQEVFESQQHLLESGRLHVEIRYDHAEHESLRAALDHYGVEVIQDMPRGGWLEAAIYIDGLPEIARMPGLGRIGLARLPEYHGGTTSEAVEAGQADLWHEAGYGGGGINIAVVDAYNDTDDQIDHLQSQDDWPPDEQLTLIDMNPCASFGGCEPAPPHGNAVLEVIYDLAPDAHYLAYDAQGQANTIQAVYDAVDDGADIINLSLSIPADTPGDGSAPPGSLAEAIAHARNENVLVVISAGNSRLNHWGGQFHNPGGTEPGSYHHWGDDDPDWANYRLVLGSRCVPDGTGLTGILYWNDWDAPDNDYRLVLLRFEQSMTTFESSDNEQTGQSWQEPRESISTTAQSDDGHPACGANEAKYAWAIYNYDALGVHNFRFWSSNLEDRTFSSTLSTPADSPDALTVGAIFAGSENLLGVSAEGPILGPGGAAPTGKENPKPDLVSFASVDNTTFGSFSGTSASAPHATGMAALLWERHRWPFGVYSADQVAERLRQIAQQGSNDFAPAGHNFQTGWGRLRFQAETDIAYVTQPSDTGVNQPITPNVEVEILDDEGLRVLSGPTQFMDVEIENDPSGGQATLFKPFPYPVLDGLAPISGLEIDELGEGYTLLIGSQSNDIEAESGPFDIVDEIFADRFEQ